MVIIKLRIFVKITEYLWCHVLVALTLGGQWKIYDKNSVNTSFPDFFKILKKLGAKINWKLEKIS